jgi:hypothetical protein
VIRGSRLSGSACTRDACRPRCRTELRSIDRFLKPVITPPSLARYDKSRTARKRYATSPPFLHRHRSSMPPMPIRRIHPTACGRHRVRPTVSPRKFACQTFSLSEDMSPTPEVCPEERAIHVTGGQTKHGFNFRFMPEQMARVRAFHDTGTPMRRVALVTRMSSLYGNRCICAVSATKQRSEVRLRRCRRNRITRTNITPRWCRSVANRFAVLCLRAVKMPRRVPACGSRIETRRRASQIRIRESTPEKLAVACRSTRIFVAVSATARSRHAAHDVRDV